MTGVVKVGGIRQYCFAMEVQGSGKHLSGNGNYPRRREEREGLCANATTSVRW